MAKVAHNGIAFDSPDELEMYHWCEEAKQHGLLEDFTYQEPTWVLSEPVRETIPQFGVRGQPLKGKARTILRGATYTVDFHLIGASEELGVPEYLDVKPAFTRQDSQKAKFAVLQKWLYQRHGVLVYGVVPLDLFKRTFCPEACKLTPKRKQPRKGYYELPSVKEMIEWVKLRK